MMVITSSNSPSHWCMLMHLTNTLHTVILNFRNSVSSVKKGSAELVGRRSQFPRWFRKAKVPLVSGVNLRTQFLPKIRSAWSYRSWCATLILSKKNLFPKLRKIDDIFPFHAIWGLCWYRYICIFKLKSVHQWTSVVNLMMWKIQGPGGFQWRLGRTWKNIISTPNGVFIIGPLSLPRDVEKNHRYRLGIGRQDGRSSGNKGSVKVGWTDGGLLELVSQRWSLACTSNLPLVDAGAFQIWRGFLGFRTSFELLLLIQGSVAKLFKLGQRCKRWSIS